MASYATYVRGNVRRRVHVDDVRRLPRWDELLCLGCSTNLSFNKGGPTIAPHFKHLRRTAAEIKEHCRFYLGGEEYESWSIEGGEHRLSLALDADRDAKGQQWKLYFRLPQFSDASGTVGIETGHHHVRKIHLGAVANVARDYSIYPAAGRIRIEAEDEEAEAYVHSLSSTSVAISPKRIYAFPETKQRRSAWTSIVNAGRPYYFVAAELTLPDCLRPIALKTDSSSEGFRGWSCYHVTIPDLVDRELLEWMKGHAGPEVSTTPSNLTVLFPVRVGDAQGSAGTSIVPSDVILVGFGASHLSSSACFAYSDDICESRYVRLNGLSSGCVRVSCDREGHLAIGISDNAGDSNWPVEYHLRPIKPYEPVAPELTFSYGGRKETISAFDSRLEDALYDVRNRRCTLAAITVSAGCALKMSHRGKAHFGWTADDELANSQDLTKLLVDPALDVRVELAGIPCATVLAHRFDVEAVQPSHENVWRRSAAANLARAYGGFAPPNWAQRGSGV